MIEPSVLDTTDVSFLGLVTVTAMQTKERRPAFRSAEGWANVRNTVGPGFLETPYAHERAILAARHARRPGVVPDGAVAVTEDVLCSIGDANAAAQDTRPPMVGCCADKTTDMPFW